MANAAPICTDSMPSTTSPTGGTAPGTARNPLIRRIVLVASAFCFMACIFSYFYLTITSNLLQRPDEVLIPPTLEPTFHSSSESHPPRPLALRNATLLPCHSERSERIILLTPYSTKASPHRPTQLSTSPRADLLRQPCSRNHSPAKPPTNLERISPKLLTY